MMKRFFIGIIFTSLLSGCLVGPKYKRPAIPAPDAYRGAAPAADPTSLADLKWFEVFQDERLQELVRTALARNYDLREAVARVDAARANLGLARADQLPSVSVTGDFTTQGNSRNGGFPFPAGVNRDRTFGGTALNLLSFELDIWGRLRRATEAARADLLAAEETRRAVVTTLVGDSSALYFSLIELDAELEIARRTLTSREESLRLIRLREQGGVATMLEVRQGEQLVYAATQTIADLERQVEQTENRISLLLGRNPGEIARGRSLNEQPKAPDIPPGLPSSLLERRPDIRAAEQSLVASNARIGVAKAAYFPRIGLTSFLGGQSDQLENLFSGPSRAWSFAPQLTQPIFTAGRIKSNVRGAEAGRDIALVQYERTIQTAFRETADALVEQRKRREIRAQRELLVTTLRDRSSLAYLRYRGGVDTLLNALDADRDLFNAELSLAQARRDELLALVQLYKALGGGWQ